MLSQEDNDILTRVGPGTPMGEFMRRFWTPALLSKELSEPDGEPVPVRLLGEDLIAFRNTDGKVGLLDRYCPHRRASLFFGRNEECGLRCVYHGWKFDIEGNCLDMPSEPPATDFKHKVKLTAYPTEEHGGVIWAYMGPKDKMGEVPDFEWMHVPENYRYQSHWHQPCNYAQAVEGEIDSAHVSFLHSRIDAFDKRKTGITGEFFNTDRAPKWKVNETDYGMVLGARRSVDEGYYWRMNQWLYPFYTMIAPVPGQYITSRMWVPIDDTNCSIICVSYRNDAPCSEEQLGRWKAGKESHPRIIAGTYTTAANMGNNYLIDRQKQRTQSYTGIDGVRDQDSAVVESMGPITDRTKERLGTSDTAIIKMRRLMIDGAKALQRGIEPTAAQGGALYRVRSHSVVIPEPVDFDERADILEAMVVSV